MMKPLLRFLLIAAFACASLPSCSYYSKTARDQRSYDKYVKKNAGIRYKQRVKMKTPRIQSPPPGEPQISAGTMDGPQAVPSQGDGGM